MNRLPVLLAFFLSAGLLAGGCEQGPKIDPAYMKRTLGSSVFAFHKALNGARFDEARTYVASSAEDEFEALAEGMRRGDYNFFFGADQPEVDFIDKSARVKVQLFKGAKMNEGGFDQPRARPVTKQVHRWEYVNGSWQWLGPVSR